MAADRDLRRRREVADVDIVIVTDRIQCKCGFRVLQLAGNVLHLVFGKGIGI